ncbi:MAG: hypothetical protein U0031_15160 [Thermomicrobiales bacterium]
MNWANVLHTGRGGNWWHAVIPRIVLATALLAAVTVALMSDASAGGARIASSYSLSGGTIRIQGSNFRANANIRVTIVDTSQGAGFEITRELTARSNNRGAFSVSSEGWCPRTVEITATSGRGKTAHDTMRNSDCPW